MLCIKQCSTKPHLAAVPLAPVSVDRTPIHSRKIDFQAFRRADGLWDIEARLIDVKQIDCALESGVRPAGQPIHDMWLRITIDTDYNVVAAQAVTDIMPYPGFCQTITPTYEKLVGLNLLKNFRLRVADLYRGTAGCTHLTELLAVVPTAAVQSIFIKSANDTKPFQLDRCHALDTTGEAVARYYPRWYVGADKPSSKRP